MTAPATNFECRPTSSGGVLIIVRVGEKTARITVTPKKAQDLSAELLTASLEATGDVLPRGWM